MAHTPGKFETKNTRPGLWKLLPAAVFFFLTELFGWQYLKTEATGLWPLAFGLLWSGILTGLLSLLPGMVGRIAFGLLFGISMVWSVGQTGYYLLFSEMMWLSEFRYASEGAAYADVIFAYPLLWYGWIFVLLGLGIFQLVRWPKTVLHGRQKLLSGLLTVLCAACTVLLPEAVFLADSQIRYAGSDYGRAQSAEAAYDNMFNPHRLYQVCGLYQMLAKDVYTNTVYPMTPAYAAAQEEGRAQIDAYFAQRGEPEPNEMTGLLQGKNVIVVLMESMDDWMIGDHTPTICRLMEEGIDFTEFYTPAYGGIRTFNTEFCLNTGSFLSSAGGYAFDHVTNTYNQSLAALLGKEGYSAKVFHYNSPNFYSRGVFSEALGYEEYVCYEDYLQDLSPQERKNALYDELTVFKFPELRQEFFREGSPTLNFVITRSAHLSYKYNEVLSHWALRKYPQYRGMTGHEETDCALVKARLVDDFFQWLLMVLEEEGQLENTVIVGITDHYTYGYKDTEELFRLSGVEHSLWLEKVPCFIWSADLEPVTVDKTLNTSDLLPTLLNLLGVEPGYDYMGRDAFDPDYDGFVPFSDGGWISGDAAYCASEDKLRYREGAQPVSYDFCREMEERVKAFTTVNNLILETDYYQ